MIYFNMYERYNVWLTGHNVRNIDLYKYFSIGSKFCRKMHGISLILIDCVLICQHRIFKLITCDSCHSEQYNKYNFFFYRLMIKKNRSNTESDKCTVFSGTCFIGSQLVVTGTYLSRYKQNTWRWLLHCAFTVPCVGCMETDVSLNCLVILIDWLIYLY